MSDVTKIMSRVRKAIRDFDPSYRLKANGHICAKEWREIMPPYIKLIAGVRVMTKEEMIEKYGRDVAEYAMLDVVTTRKMTLKGR